MTDSATTRRKIIIEIGEAVTASALDSVLAKNRAAIESLKGPEFAAVLMAASDRRAYLNGLKS